MRKVVFSSLAVLVLFAVLLSACSGNTSPPTQTNQPVKSPQASAVPVQGQIINLKYAHHQPPQSHFGASQAKWAEEVTKASNGKVQITVYPSGTLVKMQDEYDSLLSGLCDITLLTPDITPGRFPLSGIDILPLLYPNAETLAATYWDIIQKYYVTTDFSKMKVIGIQAMPPMQIASKKPVQKLEDFKGLKWRVEGSVEKLTMEALGASATLLDTGDIFTSLDKGVIDGISFLWEGMLSFGFHQITQYRTEAGLYCRGPVVVMNLEKWNSLPDDVKAVFDQFGGQAYAVQAAAIGDQAMNGAKMAIVEYDKKVGNPGIYTLPADERARWVTACQPVWEKWAQEKDAAGHPGSAILADTQELVKKYTK